MKYSLDLYIVCNTQSTLDEVSAKIPAIIDPTVWDGEYTLPSQSRDEETGNQVLIAIVRFHDDVDRDTIANSVQNVASLFGECEVGTYVRSHICHHDTSGVCEITSIYEVVA